jgi:hypothetical protein
MAATDTTGNSAANGACRLGSLDRYATAGLGPTILGVLDVAIGKHARRRDRRLRQRLVRTRLHGAHDIRGTLTNKVFLLSGGLHSLTAGSPTAAVVLLGP